MGTPVYNTLQVFTTCFSEQLKQVAEEADRLELAHTGIVKLPINGYHFLCVYPSGSNAWWPEENHHLSKLTQLTTLIDKINHDYDPTDPKCRPLHYAHTQCLDDRDVEPSVTIEASN